MKFKDIMFKIIIFEIFKSFFNIEVIKIFVITFKFNDTNVSKVNFDGKNNTSGYCLFYRKKLNK